MTHVNILMVGRIVSETQTDRQLKFIIDKQNLQKNTYIQYEIKLVTKAVEIVV